MEALRGDDSITFGDDSGEENYRSANETLSNSEDTVDSVVDSIKSTVKSAVGLLPHVSLGLEAEQYRDKADQKLEDEGKERGVETEQNRTSVEKLHFGGEISPGQEGSSGLEASEDWAVVDPIPQAQDIVSEKDREQEKQEAKESEPAVDVSDVAEGKAGKAPSECPPPVAAKPAVPGSDVAEKPSTSSRAGEQEIQEVYNNAMPIAPATVDSSTDRIPFSYNDKPASLRRRSRSLKSSEGAFNPLEPGAASFYSSTSPTGISRERDGDWGFKERAKEVSDERHRRPAGRQGTKPRGAEDLKGKGQLQDELYETTGPSSGWSGTVDINGDQRRRSMYPSGYDSESDEDDTESEVIQLERRSRSKGKKKEEAVGSSSNVEGEGHTPIKSSRREVYVIPDNDIEELDQGASSSQFLSWPAELLVQAVGFQVKLIINVVAISIWMFNFACSLVSRPINRTLEVKDRATDMATGAINQGFGLISQVKDGVAHTGPLVSKLSKKTMMGCLGSVYVIFVLSILLVPAFFLDMLLVRRMVEEPVQLRETLNFNYTEPRPSATVALLSLEELEKAKTLPVDKLVSFRKISAGHNFHVNVILTMPESEYNVGLGMFQVTAEMLSARNHVLMRQSKPCMLRFRSAPIRLLKTMLYSVPLMMGFSTETQQLEITVLRAQEKLIPTASVRILLEPKAGFPQGAGLPELYEAELHLESALPWPKAIVRRWKWTFYVWNGVCLFLFEVAMILCCCRQVLLPGLGGKRPSDEDIVVGEVKKPKESASKRSKNKRRVYFEDDVPGAAGEQGVEDSSLPVDRSEDADSVSNSSEDADKDGGWSIPLEETLEKVGEGVRVVEETVKTLGGTLVEGVAEGLGDGLTHVVI